MGKKQINVLHVDTGSDWRGGQQQVAYLLEKMYTRQYNTALACQPDSELRQFCLKKQLPFFSVRMRGELDFTAGYRLAHLCRKHGFNLLHLHTAHALSIGLIAKFFLSQLKLIAVRRVDFHIKKHVFSQFKYNTAYIDKIVCISDGIKNVLLRDGIAEKKLVTIHSGVDLDKYNNVVPPADFRDKLNISSDHILIGTIAAIAGHKDYPNLLTAAKKVIEQSENVTFCAVGDGPAQERVHRLAQELQLGSRFIFTGYRRDLGHFLKSFDLFVLASRKEGLGTSILDAQAVGLPVVACATGGIPEAVHHLKNGLLVPPKNSSALAAALLKLSSDQEMRIRFGNNARESVKQFDINNTVNKNLELYQQLLS